MQKWTVLLCVLGLGPLAAAAVEDSPFEGHYECTGNELGTNEHFILNMTIEKSEETYSIQSRYETDLYFGTGIYDSTNKSLSAAFVNPDIAAPRLLYS